MGYYKSWFAPFRSVRCHHQHTCDCGNMWVCDKKYCRRKKCHSCLHAMRRKKYENCRGEQATIDFRYDPFEFPW